MLKHCCTFLLFVLCCSATAHAQQYFPIKVNKKWGLIDADGQVILQPVYDAIGEFKEYGYATMQREGRVGMLNRLGEEIVLPKYDDIKILDSTLVAVMDQGEWQVLNLEGKLILKKGYEQVKVWDGRFIGYQKNRLWGISHKDGSIITEPIYDEIEWLSEKAFLVRKGNGLGLLSEEGGQLLKTDCGEIIPFNTDLFFFKIEKSWGIFERHSGIVVQAAYNTFQVISGNFIKLSKAGVNNLFSVQKGQVVTTQSYDNFYPFGQSKALCKKNRLLGLIDEQGNFTLSVKYNEIQVYSDSIYRVRYKNKWGLVEAGDRQQSEYVYDYIAPSVYPYCVVKRDSLFGVLNVDGKEVVPIEFDNIKLSEGKATAKQGESLNLYYFDKRGNIQDENKFKKHFTITIGGKRRRNGPVRLTDLENDYLLDDFEWFYSSRKDKWGLRRLDDGSVQIEPSFDWIRIEKSLGFTVVGIDKRDYYDFEWTKYSFEMVYGFVNNSVGLLVHKVDLWDIRISDFFEGYPVARCIFNNGRHGLISKNGKILKKDYAFIGSFKNGLARMSTKGRLSGSLKDKSRGLGRLQTYLTSLFSPNFMTDYTLYDQEFKEEAVLTCEGCEWGYIDTAANVLVQPQYSFVRDFINEVGIVEYEGKWGMIDHNGEDLIPCAYDELHFLENTENKIVRVYKKKKKYGLIDTTGQVRVDFSYDQLGAFNDNRLAVKRNGMWGFVDKNGREVVPCRFRKVNNFSEGIAAVQLSSKWGFIDKQGDVVLDFEYRRAGNFKNGLAWVYTEKGTHFIDTEGRMVIPSKFRKAFDFEGNLARVVVDGKYGLIDRKGKFVVEPMYTDIQPFNEYGLAVARLKGRNSRYVLINQVGMKVTSRNFKEIRPFKEGLAAVKYKNGYGFINFTGKIVIPSRYSKVSDFSEGYAAVQKNGQCGYIDFRGKEVIDFQFTKCLDFFDGKAVVYKGYKQGGIIDTSGHFVIEPSINRLFSFKEGRGLVRDSKYRFYYITEAAEMHEGYFDKASDFQHGVAVVQSEGKWGIINQRGIAIIPPKYDKIEDFKEGYAKVRIKGFSGLTNLQGELIVQPDYEYISYAGEGLFRVEQGDKIGYFNEEGNWIWDLNE
ncbi:MAG: WG repeat-containing protein [Bacteroidota bacterium]